MCSSARPHLSANDEPIGAQGISLTPGRSIAVDRKLHTYGTPFFISAYLPIEGLKPDTWFRRLMIAQDTGGAIVGPARADLYFGAGDEAASIAGRLRHDGRFVMLAPKELVPAADDEFRCPGGGRPIDEMAAYEKLAAKQEAETEKAESKTEEQGAGDHGPGPEARQQTRQDGGEGRRAAGRKNRRRQEVSQEAQAARPNRTPNRNAKRDVKPKSRHDPPA